MDQPWPFVTVVIPMFNEERYIAACLDSVLANDYPHERLEILVVDGGSTDRSREIVLDYCSRYRFIRLLDNPRRIVPVALNIGIREAKGDIIVRMDAHTLYAPDYIRQCVELLRMSGAVNVGGVARAVGTNYLSRAIAAAMSSAFGVGDAYFRYAEREMWVDTVYPGAWWKHTLLAAGGYREDMEVNEDYELNVRLRKAGGRLLLSPKIRCWYYVRCSLRALAKQYFRYGFWKVRTLVLHPDSLRWRQLAPPALVIGLLFSGLAGVFHWPLWFALPMIYSAANVLASIHTGIRKGWTYAPILPLVFATIHFSWGLGFLLGLFRWGIPAVSLRILVRSFAPVGRK